MFIRKIYRLGLATLNFIFAVYSQKTSCIGIVTTTRNEIPTTKSPIDVICDSSNMFVPANNRHGLFYFFVLLSVVCLLIPVILYLKTLYFFYTLNINL